MHMKKYGIYMYMSNNIHFRSLTPNSFVNIARWKNVEKSTFYLESGGPVTWPFPKKPQISQDPTEFYFLVVQHHFLYSQLPEKKSLLVVHGLNSKLKNWRTSFKSWTLRDGKAVAIHKVSAYAKGLHIGSCSIRTTLRNCILSKRPESLTCHGVFLWNFVIPISQRLWQQLGFKKRTPTHTCRLIVGVTFTKVDPPSRQRGQQ